MKVRIIPAAEADASRAQSRLEREEPGFGARFAAEMRSAIQKIRSAPWICPITDDGPENPETRECFIRLFNYRVIFTIWNDVANVVAVIHSAREPGIWISRLALLDKE